MAVSHFARCLHAMRHQLRAYRGEFDRPFRVRDTRWMWGQCAGHSPLPVFLGLK